jgi:hypothetical protein
MHFMYSFCDGNSLTALREYQCRYPDQRHYQHIFETVHRNLRETGTLMLHVHAGCGRRNVQGENVLNIIHDNPSSSTCHISSATGQLSQSAVW